MEVSFDFLLWPTWGKKSGEIILVLRVCFMSDFLWEKKGDPLLNWGSG